MNKNVFKKALTACLPVISSFIVIGISFGVVVQSRGFGPLWAGAMSVFIYAGSMQFVALELIGSGASLLTAAITTVMVNLRHVFYGLSMVDKYKTTGAFKPYLIYALSDETYSLVCNPPNCCRGSSGISICWSLPWIRPVGCWAASWGACWVRPCPSAPRASTSP